MRSIVIAGTVFPEKATPLSNQFSSMIMSLSDNNPTAAVGIGPDSGGRGVARHAPSSSGKGLVEGCAGSSANMATASGDGRDVFRGGPYQARDWGGGSGTLFSCGDC